jgi:hypothetical protein
MKYRIELEKKIEKKKQEIASLETQIKEAQAYVLGLQEALRMLPKDNPLPFSAPVTESAGGTNGRQRTDEYALRQGGVVYKAWQALKKEGKPLYISDLLRAIGKEPTKANRKSLSGTLNGYYREGRIFTRPQANTFGLVEFTPDGAENENDELPDDFGMDGHEEEVSEATGGEIDF